MAIYTKKGDGGETNVFDKKTGKLANISKSSCKIAAIGTIDELNSFLGVVGAEIQSDKGTKLQRELEKKIVGIQTNLFTINSILAGSNLQFSKTKTTKLEMEIDNWEKVLPVQKNFMYYGGSKIASLLFYARALCRRAERSLVSFSHIHYTNPNILVYFNRLSDYLFILGRATNSQEGIKEEFWKTSK